MASRIKAIGALRPRIDLGKTVQKAELTRYLAARTNLSEGQIDHVIEEMRDAIIFFNQSGRGVKVEGLGTYLPKINLNGRFSIEHRPDMDIKNALNTLATCPTSSRAMC